MPQIELTPSYVIYQAQTKLLELGVEIADARLRINKPKVKEAFNLAVKLRLWLKALQYSDYLDQDTITKLVLCLAQLCDANAIPYAPTITSVSPPSILVGIPGSPGSQGEEGPEGGGVPFSTSGITIDTVVDSFDIAQSGAAEWTIEIVGTDGTSGKRVMRLLGGWASDGSSYGDDGGDGTDNIYGDTSPVTMSVVVTGTTAKLFAQVTSGTWTIQGTRKYIPNNGNGITSPTSLTDGKIWIGDSSNNPTAQTFSGDVTVTNAGVTSITSGVIVNADINANAAIVVTKLSPLTSSKAVVTDASGFLTTSSTSSTQIGYLSTVTSDVQVQLDSKLSAATGAISTVVSSDLTADRAVISNPLGKIAVSATTSTELGYVSGVTSAIQTQLNNKVNSVGVTLYTKVISIGDWNMNSSGSGSDIKSVAHGLSDYKKVRSISVIVRNDADNSYYPFSITNLFNRVDSTNVNLNQVVAGNAIFDLAGFSSTSYNRGWITITYEA